MRISSNAFRTVAMCAASAAVGGTLALSAVSVASPSSHPAAASQAAAAKHYLHGVYVLTDGKCPKGTVAVNASVRGRTNSRSGHSTFPLCYVK